MSRSVFARFDDATPKSSFYLRVIADESPFVLGLVSSFSRSAYRKHWSTKFFPVKNDEEGPICDYCR